METQFKLEGHFVIILLFALQERYATENRVGWTLDLFGDPEFPKRAAPFAVTVESTYYKCAG